MLVKDIMTKGLEVIPVQFSVIEAARKMKDLNVGALPVGDQKQVQGMVTDRDIAIQIVAEGKDPHQCKVDEIMSSPINWISQESDVDEAARVMADRKVRRLIVMDDNQKPVGFLALGDIAAKGQEDKAQEALGQISKPSHPTH